MKTNTSSRTVIVVALDRSTTSDEVIQTALGMARATAGAELHFIHAVDAGQPPHLLSVPLVDLLKEGRLFLDGVTHAVAEQITAGKVAGHLAAGEPTARILQLASDLAADFIIVGTNGKNGVERLLLGSVSNALVKKARCPVLVARAKNYEAVPEIEPPCPACLDTQRSSKGDVLWCERHSSRHAHARLHYEMPQGYGAGAMFIRGES